MQLNPRNVGAIAPGTAASVAADVSVRTPPECRSPVEEWASVNLPTLYHAAPGAVVSACLAIRGLPGLVLSWRTEAPLTLLIVAINLVIHIGVAMGGDLAVDALWDIAATHSDSPFNPWRWFTSAWIHADFEHVLSNCFFLLIAGRLLEPTIGSARLALLYMVAIMGSSIASLPEMLMDYVRCGGASGAVYGVIGALLVLPTCRKLWRAILVWAIVAYDVGSDMALGPEPGIGFAAHVGGLVSGMIAGCLAGRGAEAPEESDTSASTSASEMSTGATHEAQKDQALPPRIAVISVWPDEHGAEIR